MSNKNQFKNHVKYLIKSIALPTPFIMLRCLKYRKAFNYLNKIMFSCVFVESYHWDLAILYIQDPNLLTPPNHSTMFRVQCGLELG